MKHIFLLPSHHLRSNGFLIFLLAFWLLGAAGANADDGANELDAKLHETVLYIPVGNHPQVKLQVTYMKPDGPGPFPLAVLNHGKAKGLPSNEKRYRSVYAARYFLSRGYAVILPMTRGFAGSGGETWIKGCNIENMAILQARDIAEVIEYMATQPDHETKIDTDRIVVFGQSLGGFDTLALGTLYVPGLKGLVNFAGGIQAPTCATWQIDLVIAASHFGQQTKVPSIWFYGNNDATFAAQIWQGMFNKYIDAGGNAELIAYGSFMDDAHNFLGKIEALPIWVPKLDAFLASIGLPHTNLHPELMPAPYPKASGFAAIDDPAALPLVNDKGRQEYQEFLKKDMPRVFMIAANGAGVSTNGGYDPLERGQALCKQHNLRCQTYAVDDQVVWPKPLPVPPPTTFAKLEDVAAVPYLTDSARQMYQRFLTLPNPRAFVIAPDGGWAFSSKDFDVLASALHICQAKHQGCRPYAINDQVVWPENNSPVAEK